MLQLSQLISLPWIFLLPLGQTEQQEEKLNITVYFEACCPGSKIMVEEKVPECWNELKEYINFELLPYGNAQQEKSDDGSWIFTCQHGPEECYGNKILACGLKYETDEDAKIEFACCIMRNNTLPFNLSCFNNKENEDKFQHCSSSEEGDDLMAEIGTKTHAMDPPSNGMPSIAFNNVHNLSLENEARWNLVETVCNLLKNEPEACQ